MSERPHCLAREACQAKGDGHCRRCWGTFAFAQSKLDPEANARRRAGAAETLGRLQRARLADPAYRAKLAESARRHGTLLRPDVKARAADPAVRARMEAARIATVNAMSPEERRQKYGSKVGYRSRHNGSDLALFDQLRAKKIPAAEAHAIVLRQAAAAISRAASAAQLRHEREKAQRFDIFTITIAEEDL